MRKITTFLMIMAFALFAATGCDDDSGTSGSNDGTNNAQNLCGNGVIDGTEECDGTDLGGKSCQDLGSFTGGTLACSAQCTFVTNECEPGNANDGTGTNDGTDPDPGPIVLQWKPFVVTTLEAEEDHPWNTFPVEVTFTHEDGSTLTVHGYWIGDRKWAVRFAPTLPGRWEWEAHTSTGDAGLQGSGHFTARAPTAEEIAENPNLHGHVLVDGRYFRYADGTPFLPIGDTFWRCNTMLPLGRLDSGFPSYIEDRMSKGFNSVLIQYISASLDSNYNEGGYLWDPDVVPPDQPDGMDWDTINPAYFESLDTRIQTFWDNGLVVFGHPTWLVELPDITVDQAIAISRYLLARYGAYNIVWSLTGEFHLACENDDSDLFCVNDYEALSELGDALIEFNPYHHPMSVHPGGWNPGAPQPDAETSRIFEGEAWLDHHWIQTYAETDKIVYRVAELRGDIPGGLDSERPVLMAEPSYEWHTNGRYTDWDQGDTEAELEASKARRQAWTSMFVGAAGHIYGAHGIWQADTPEALDFEGSSQVPLVGEFLSSIGWPELQPAACVEVEADGAWEPPTLDYPADASDRAAVLEYTYSPRCLFKDTAVAVYIPAGNEDRTIRVAMLGGREYTASWFDPRTGDTITIDDGSAINQDHDDYWTIPQRPAPSNDDWVLLLTAQ